MYWASYMYIHITDSLIFCLLYTLASMKLLKSLEWNNTQKEKKLINDDMGRKSTGLLND